MRVRILVPILVVAEIKTSSVVPNQPLVDPPLLLVNIALATTLSA